MVLIDIDGRIIPHILGTPFITKMIGNTHNTLIANRLKVYYIGVKGIINKCSTNLIMSYSLNKRSDNNATYQEQTFFVINNICSKTKV
jgi:hypothetical protein